MLLVGLEEDGKAGLAQILTFPTVSTFAARRAVSGAGTSHGIAAFRTVFASANAVLAIVTKRTGSAAVKPVEAGFAETFSRLAGRQAKWR
ncbi:unnamed protein product [Protopolystoma xenopodis]|uniref:Uncharacterized protein n=1 Tax=Protopolystoma xenopodis TaxID=117903 RepID=A0A448XMR9_9PLAT|nr:unnamed protein product [Protopolystoma xenopodis]